MWTSLHFLLMCTIFSPSCGQNSASSPLLDMLHFLCPNANVCGRNKTQRLFTSAYESCCTDCSCNPDCEENGNCCFPLKQPYTNRTEDSDDASKDRRDCLFPTTLELRREQKLLYKSYYMVSSVSADNLSTSDVSCGDVPVALWGSLFPVYSAERNQIYKNIKCANLDGVTDSIAWDVVLTCRDGIPYHALLDSDFKSGSCYVSFIYREELQPLRCYRDVIDVCPHFKFNKTDVIELSEKEINKACTSGLVSPYRKTKMYANVFCHICNEGVMDRDLVCPALYTATPMWGINKGSFTALINSDLFLKEDFIKTKTHAKSRRIKTACNSLGKQSCRPVHCRSRQIYDKFDICKYPIMVLYNQIFRVLLNLTTEADVKFIELLRYNVSALRSPWPRDWLVTDIDYDVTNSDENKTHIRVIMMSKKNKIRTISLMKSVEELVKRKWVFEINITKYVLKSDLMTRQSDFLKISSPVLHGAVWRSSIPITITSLYFCDQVELTPSEFVLSDNNSILFNLITQRHTFNGEFTLIKSNQMVNVRARICIEDSGFFEVSQTALSKPNTNVCILCILVTSTVLLF